jgi:hypothetical protein
MSLIFPSSLIFAKRLHLTKHLLPLCLIHECIANTPALTKSLENFLMRLKGTSKESLSVAPAARELLAS